MVTKIPVPEWYKKPVSDRLHPIDSQIENLTTTMAVVQTCQARSENLKGIIRRFQGEKNQLAVTVATNMLVDMSNLVGNDLENIKDQSELLRDTEQSQSGGWSTEQISDMVDKTILHQQATTEIAREHELDEAAKEHPEYAWYKNRIAFICNTAAIEFCVGAAADSSRNHEPHLYLAYQKAIERVLELNTNIMNVIARDQKMPKPFRAAKRLINQVSTADARVYDVRHSLNKVKRQKAPVFYSKLTSAHTININQMQNILNQFKNEESDYVFPAVMSYDEETGKEQFLDLAVMDVPEGIFVKRMDDGYPKTHDRTLEEITNHLQNVYHKCRTAAQKPSRNKTHDQRALRVMQQVRTQLEALKAGIIYLPRENIVKVMHAAEEATGDPDIIEKMAGVIAINKDLLRDNLIDQANEIEKETDSSANHEDVVRKAIEAGLPYDTITVIMSMLDIETFKTWNNMMTEYPHLPKFLPEAMTGYIVATKITTQDYKERYPTWDEWTKENQITSTQMEGPEPVANGHY